MNDVFESNTFSEGLFKVDIYPRHLSVVISYTLYFTLLICNVIKIPSKIISLPAQTLVSPYLFKRDKANPYLFSTV